MAYYGTSAGVASRARRYTINGEWTNETNPSATAVVSYLDQVSGMFNTALAAKGFTTPITDADALKAITMVVELLVSDMCKADNGTGRFYSEKAIKNGMSQWRMITNDIESWVDQYASGLEAQGAGRGESNEFEIGYRSTDERGNNTFPIFQRNAFGNDFTDWDSDS